MNRLFLILMFLIGLGSVQAQSVVPPAITVSSDVEVVDGVKYYLHKVESGNTLYSIAKAYGLNTIDIIKLNPEAEFGIKVGEILRIPSVSSMVVIDGVDQNSSDSNFTYHIVKDKESLTSIAEIYGVTAQQILKLNPNCKEPIEKGTLLKIPIFHDEIDFTSASKTIRSDVIMDNTVKAVVKQHDTLTNFVPLNVRFGENETISIALFLPLQLDRVNGTVADMVNGVAKKTTDIEGLKYIGIYEGMLVAVNQLAENGLKVKMSVYDCGRDVKEVSSILNENTELLKTDVIFSYTYYESFKLIEDFAQKHNIVVVNGLSSRKDIVKDNKQVFKVVPSSNAITDAIADYIVRTMPKSNIVIAKTKGSESEDIANRLNNSFAEYGYVPIHKYVTYGDELMTEVAKLPEVAVGKRMDIDSLNVVKNIVILIGSSEVFIMNSLRNISKAKSKHCIIFGLPVWNQDRQNSIVATDVNYVKNMNMRFIADRSIDMKSSATQLFVEDFETMFGLCPEDVAMLSYDLTMFFAAAIKEYGNDFYSVIPRLRYSGVYSGYRFVNVNGGGYENVFWNIYKYKNYEVDNLNRDN